MSSFNKIVIVGHLGRDPELKHTPQGTAVCKMSVATAERRKNAAGESEERTTWFRVTAWGRQAELANEYLSKGRQVYIEGRLRQETYVDRDGVERASLEVNCSDLHFIGARNDQAEPPAGDERAAPKAPAPKPMRAPRPGSVTTAQLRQSAGLASIEEDEIPF